DEAGTGRRHKIAPSARFKQIVSRVFPSNPVRKMRSPQMQGEELPEGSVVRQSKLDLGPNETGGFALAEMPSPPGPRNCGHCSDAGATSEIAPMHADNEQSLRLIKKESVIEV